MRRRRGSRLSHVQWGLLFLVVLVVITYFGFTKAVPFRDHYEIKAVFENSTTLRVDSLVRVAGVNVGKVTKIEPQREGEEGAVVTMRIDDPGLPIHKDATVTLRQRIFLEGNLFVDIRPGTPTAPRLEDGDTIPVNQTSYPVQLDQVLTALQRDTREDLKKLLDEYSTALGGEGARGFNRSIPWWEPAYKNTAIVNQATLGLVEGDLRGWIRNQGAFAQALNRRGEALKSLITDFNTTAAAFANQRSNLEAAIAELPRTLGAAQPALAALNDAFPPTRELVADLRPAVRSSGPTIDEVRPLVAQLSGLMSPAELQGLAADLRPTIPALAQLNARSIPLYRQVSLAASCQNEVILPWTRDTVPDDQFPARGPVFEESVKWLPGISGESRSGDANGQWFRVLAGGGNYTALYGNGRIAQLTTPIQGTNPPKPQPSSVSPTGRPPIQYDVDCETQERPNLDTRTGPAPTQFRNDIDTPAEKTRYLAARTRAVEWLRDQLKAQGLDDLLTVVDEELTPQQLEDLLGGLAPLSEQPQSGGRDADVAPPPPGPGEIQLPGIGNLRAPPPPGARLIDPEELPDEAPPVPGAVQGADGLPLIGGRG